MTTEQTPGDLATLLQQLKDGTFTNDRTAYLKMAEPLPDRSRVRTAWCETCPNERNARRRKNGVIMCSDCYAVVTHAGWNPFLLRRLADATDKLYEVTDK